VWFRALLVGVSVVAGLGLVGSAQAYTGECADDTINLQLCERAEVAADVLVAMQADGVALAEEDQDRLDLLWWGVWANVGLSFTLLVSPMFVRAFRFWRE